MTENASPMMVNRPVFPMGGFNSGATGDSEERITSLEIASIAGKRHADVMRSIRTMEKSWLKVAERNFALGSYLDENGQARPCYYLTKRESLYVGTKFNDEARAKLVLRWEELEIKHREQAQAKMQAEQVNLDKKVSDYFDIKLKWLNFLPGYLNLSDVSKLAMAKKIAEPLGLPTPDYVSAPNGAKHSATYLLKSHNVGLSARKFNELAAKAGLLELKERNGTSKVHKYCEITKKGLAYGENDINEKNMNQVQPHWYDNKFDEVLSVIGYKPSEQTDMFVNGEAHK